MKKEILGFSGGNNPYIFEPFQMKVESYPGYELIYLQYELDAGEKI